MTDKLSRHWNQPRVDDFLYDGSCAVMTQAVYDKFPTYNTSVPTALYVGKMWISEHPDKNHAYLHIIFPHHKPDMVTGYTVRIYII